MPTRQSSAMKANLMGNLFSCCRSWTHTHDTNQYIKIARVHAHASLEEATPIHAWEYSWPNIHNLLLNAWTIVRLIGRHAHLDVWNSLILHLDLRHQNFDVLMENDVTTMCAIHWTDHWLGKHPRFVYEYVLVRCTATCRSQVRTALLGPPPVHWPVIGKELVESGQPENLIKTFKNASGFNHLLLCWSAYRHGSTGTTSSSALESVFQNLGQQQSGLRYVVQVLLVFS